MTIFGRLRSRRALLATLFAAVAVVAVACQPVKPPPEQQPGFPPFGGLIETNPPLFPHFSTDITDYVSRCNANTFVLFSVNAPQDTTVSVDGQPPASGQFNTFTIRDYNQSFPIVVQGPSGPPTTHYVRCLPPDFPDWSAQRNGQTEAGFYLTSPTGTPVIFDNNGVPIWWWTGPNPGTSFSTFFNGHVTFGISAGGPNTGLPANDHFEEHALDGSLVKSFNTVGAESDGHDVIRLPNGNYAMVTSELHDADIPTAWGNPNLPDDPIIDHVIQEVTPQGALVWSWRTSDHIPPAETPDHWRGTLIGIDAVSHFYDIYHWNSIEWTGSGFIVSYRHEDAVYKIDQTTSSIVWKLGGSDHNDCVNLVCVPKSLEIDNDPIGNFSGQHDARLLSDGSVTVHDNQTFNGHPPRAVRYTIDTNPIPPVTGKAGTATLQESVTDPLAQSSFCCGSARKLSLPNGHWVIGWGGTAQPPGSTGDQVTEEKDGNTVVFELLVHGLVNPLYRAVPILPNQLSREDLRAGMDAEVAGSQSAGTQSVKPQTPNAKIGPEPAP